MSGEGVRGRRGSGVEDMPLEADVWSRRGERRGACVRLLVFSCCLSSSYGQQRDVIGAQVSGCTGLLMLAALAWAAAWWVGQWWAHGPRQLCAELLGIVVRQCGRGRRTSSSRVAKTGGARKGGRKSAQPRQPGPRAGRDPPPGEMRGPKGQRPMRAQRTSASDRRWLILASINVCTLALRGSGSQFTGSDTDCLPIWLSMFAERKIDIAAMQECRVAGQVDLAPIAGYKCFFSGGKRRQHGVGAAVKVAIAHCIEHVFYISDRLMAICLNLGDSKLTVVVAYAPAHNNKATYGAAVASFWKLVERTLAAVVPREFLAAVILLGDFNARLGRGGSADSPYARVLGDSLREEEQDYAATALLGFCVSHGFTVADSFFHNDAGTATWVTRRWLSQVADTGGYGACPELQHRGAIDHCLLHGAVEAHWCGVDAMCDTLTLTDHRLLRLETTLLVKPQGTQHRHALQRRSAPRLDFKSLTAPGVTRIATRQALQSSLDLLVGGATERGLYDELRGKILDACADVLPPLPTKRMKRSPDWFQRNAAELSKLMTRQWRARKRFLAAESSLRKKNAWKECQRLTLKRCRQLKSEFWTEVGGRLSTLYEKNDREGFFREINTAYGVARHAGTSGRACGVGDSSPLLWDKARKFRIPRTEEIHRWKEHFQELLNQPGEAGDYSQPLPDVQGLEELLDAPFTLEELDTALGDMKSGRATGADGIPIEVQKFAFSEEMRLLLLQDFNEALLSGTAKSDWKDVIISVLFKKGDPSLCDNYRGISLINHEGKLLERLLQNRLLPFAMARGLIPRCQFGFTAGVGAADAISVVSHVTNASSTQDLPTFNAFVDLTKAYDKVDREAL